MQVDRQTLVFFIIMFIFLSLPNTGDEPHSSKDKETLRNFEKTIRHELGELQNSTYERGYGHVEGFLLSYQDSLENRNTSEWPIHHFDAEHPWEEDEKYSIIPNSVSSKVKSFWGKDAATKGDKSYLFNISGGARGKFVKSDYGLQPVNIPIPDYLAEYAEENTRYRKYQDTIRYDDDGNPIVDNDREDSGISHRDKVGNITFNEGQVVFGIENVEYNFRDPRLKGTLNMSDPKEVIDDTVLASMSIFLLDNNQIEEHRIETQGFYFQESGSLVLTSSSAKFDAALTAPHLLMYKELFEKGKMLGKQYLTFSINQKLFSMDLLNEYVLAATDRCEFLAFLQLEKTNLTREELRDMDDELKYPQGKPIINKVPQIVVKDFLLYSPDCGIVIEKPLNSVLKGDRTEVFVKNGKRMLLGVFVLLGLQLTLFIRQIKQIKTPGQLSNISSTTLSLFGYQDSLVALIFLLATTIFQSVYLSLVSVSIVAFLMSCIFEMRLLVNVLSHQQNERGISWWEILRGSTAGSPGANNNADDNAGAQVPAPTPAAPPVTVATGDEGRLSNGLFARTFFLAIVSTFFILNVVSWRSSYRRTFEIIALFVLNSYWFPQFLRNTLKNRRRSFLWEFMIGSSVIRMVPVFYINFVEDNVFKHHLKDYLEVGLNSTWLIMQLGLLYCQQLVGPRFWINESWLPKAYNYHPILNVGDLENGFSSDILANIRELSESEGGSNAEDLTHGVPSGIVTCKVGCTICMTDIELPIIVNQDHKSDGGVRSVDKVKAQQYMITPCHHIFHSECLEDWMKYKLQCPVCRSSLPPV